MAGVLNIVVGDTKGTTFQVQENGVPIDISTYSINVVVGTLPTTTTLGADIIDGALGTARVTFDNIPAGTYPAEVVVEDTLGTQTSEQFTIVARDPL